MADPRLMRRLEPVAARFRRVRRLRLMAIAWFAAAAIGLIGYATSLLPWPLVVAGAVAAVGVMAAILATRPRREELRDAARRIEEQFPDLRAALLTAVDQRQDANTGDYGFLQLQVLTEALSHARRADWTQALPGSRLLGSHALHAMGVLAFLAVAVLLVVDRPSRGPGIAGETAGGTDEALGEAGQIVVEPGDAEVEQGSSLLVTARFEGRLPASVALVAVDAAQRTIRVPLSKSLDDPLFGGRLTNVTADLAYHIEFDGRTSDDYHITTFVYPDLVQADATIRHPEYTGLEEKSIADVRRLSVVEGSTVALTFQLNKPVASAVLIDEQDQEQPLAAEGDARDVMATTLTLDASQRYRLVLTDDAGRQNKEPPEFVIEVLPNREPDLKITFPSRDLRVSPLQEVVLAARAADDFGLKQYGLVYQGPQGGEQSLVLGGEAAADEVRNMEHLLAFEALQAAPDQLVSYYFFADDVGPDGQTRRTMSDMFFAEVRPFEEIFRQGASQQGQQQQQQQQQGQSPTMRLLEIQRQIVSATWNLIRRERRSPPSTLYARDVSDVAESQGAAMELAQEMSAELTDLAMKQYAVEATDAMLEAHARLEAASDGPSIEPLPAAREAAQNAYRALLKLQAREHVVQNSQQAQAQGQGQQSQRMQQQLNQLELKNDRNRYESERQAQQAQGDQEQENLQVLNRLRELARRQEDLNEKVKELENALREASTEQEREEIERQLKRLRDEQQDLLRDVDELRERMNQQPESRPETAEARQQLERTRENVRRASEALQQNQTSRALAAGTRAQRELEELRDEMRKQTAGQFADAVEELRNESRELAQREEELSQQLNAGAPPQPGSEPGEPPRPRPTLRQPEAPQPAGESPLAEEFRDQNQRLGALLDRLKEVVEQSETSEPLLSKRLYDAVRSIRGDKPEEALEMTAELFQRGFRDEARETEAQARTGINKLRDGVEQAAEAVLGDDVESLQRAGRELSELTRAIESELAQNDPSFGDRGENDQRENDRPENDPRENQGADRTGEQPDGDRPRQAGDDTDRRSSDDAADSPQPSGSSSGRGSGEERPLPGEEGEGQSSEERRSGGSGESQENAPSTEDEPGNRGAPMEGSEGSPMPGSPQPGASPPGSPQEGGRPSNAPGGGGRRGSEPADGNRDAARSILSVGDNSGGGAAGPHLPLTGEDYVEWSDRMREIEEILPDPELRAEAAAIRDRAREIRQHVKRHSEAPNWELVRTSIYSEMVELRQRIAEEIARREPDGRHVPIDRDPVPDRYTELVRDYYQRIGSGQ